jgi:hypothetical protein
MTDTVRHAEAGTAGWRSAARTIGAAQLDHGDMYELGGELSETLRAIEEVAGVLSQRVGSYHLGRDLRDDEDEDPTVRLGLAADALGAAGIGFTEADDAVRRFWSAIGHIGVDTTSTED